MFDIHKFERDLETLRDELNTIFKERTKEAIEKTGMSKQYIYNAVDRCHKIKVERLIEYYKRLTL